MSSSKLNNKYDYYKAKYGFYGKLNIGVVFVSVIASLSYFITDCQLYKHFAYETLINRFIVLIPLCIYLFLVNIIDNVIVKSLLAYFVAHSVIFSTMSCVYVLPDKSQATAEYVVLQIMLLVIGISTPLFIAIGSQLLFVTYIVTSGLIINYDSYSLMLTMELPVSLGIIVVLILMDKMHYAKYGADKKLESYSYHDQLTGAYNRHKLHSIMKDENIVDCIRSFIICDIDFFKKINDTYGHDYGDKVLKYVSELFRNNIDSFGYVIRWGGEEFVLVLLNHSEEDAYNLAERLRHQIEENSKQEIPITVSFGVAPFMNMSYKDSIRSADKALYVAKNTGRNKVVKFTSIEENLNEKENV